MLTRSGYDILAKELTDQMTAEEIVDWAIRRIVPERLAITTGFGMEGCALIDMFAKHGRTLEVVYLDTEVLFPETYALRDRLAARYPHIQLVNRGTSLSISDQAVLYGAELWKSNPDLCCRLRKVEPMVVALGGAEVWVTALTRNQSATRAETRIAGWDERYEVLKLAPLAHWDRARVWEYVRAHDVPYNPLHERGYPSIGCVHCTRPVRQSSITEYSRDGRWAGFNKTECGLHLPPSDDDAVQGAEPIRIGRARNNSA